MNAGTALSKLIAACPLKDSWLDEPYGAYYFNFKKEVTSALYCVTPTKGVIEQFERGGYDILISHHPFIARVPQVVLHTALDCTKGGLNDQWRDAIGVKNAKHFDDNLGWYGEIEPTDINGLRKKVRNFIGVDPIGAVYSDLDTIRSVVICSGLGGMVEREAYATGADCYILGEAVYSPLYSPFPAMIEVGHTLSEYLPGLRFVRNALGPDIIVHGADLSVDRYNNECRGL